jgi:hypothetical protein
VININKVKLRRKAYKYAEIHNCSLHDAIRYYNRLYLFNEKKDKKRGKK